MGTVDSLVKEFSEDYFTINRESPEGPVHRVLPTVLPAILAVALTVGCSRQPPPHVGEWSADFFLAGDVPLSTGTWNFFENGTIQAIYVKPPAAPYVLEGRFTFDYSKNPIQLDINWNDNIAVRGIARFEGEGKNRMHIALLFILSGKTGKL